VKRTGFYPCPFSLKNVRMLSYFNSIFKRMKSKSYLPILLFTLITVLSSAQEKTTFRGIVFFDENENGILDKKENGLKGICVSNGKDVVQSNEKGEWELQAKDKKQIFVIKPAGYAVPVNKQQIPLHFISSEQSIANEVSLGLLKIMEDKKFSTLFFGDTQARGMKEANYIFHDVVEELIGIEAAFGVSLGDIVADEPEMMDDVADGIAQIGIPWYNIFGNHDSDRDAKTNDDRDNTFEKFFGPSTYAFEYGEVVFIGLNNIYFNPDGKYKSHFTDDQLSFVVNYLKLVPENKLVVLMMH
jgi:hypothetical protein